MGLGEATGDGLLVVLFGGVVFVGLVFGFGGRLYGFHGLGYGGGSGGGLRCGGAAGDSGQFGGLRRGGAA